MDLPLRMKMKTMMTTTMMMMLIMTGIILQHGESLSTDEIYFKNTEFNLSSGLFHEKLGTLQIIGGTRKISIVLTKLKNHQYLQTFVEMLDKALNNCQKAGQLRCRERINYPRLKKQIDLATNLRAKLLEELEEINLKPTDFEQSRRKRQAEINIDTIENSFAFSTNFLDENSMTILMGNQNHTIQSELDELNKFEPKIIHELTILQNQLKNPTLNFSKELDEYMIYRNFNLILEKTSFELEKSIDEYMKYLEVMLAVINSIKQGKVHHYLIKRKQLIEFITKINDLRGNLQFPFRIDKMSVPEVLQISSMSYKMDGDDLHVILHIPLIEKNKFNFYQLHSIYVSKSLVNNTFGSGFIKPKTNFLAIDEEIRYYFPIEENILKKCHKIDGRYICHLFQAYYNVNEMNICEVKLLNSTSEEILQTCDIHVSIKQTPLWTAITSLGGWLYSLTDEERGIVSCDGDKNNSREIILKNSGILQLTTGCTLRTKTITLPSLAYKNIDFHFSHLVIKNETTFNESKLVRILQRKNRPIIYCTGSAYDCNYSDLESLALVDGSSTKMETNPLIYIILICMVTILINLSILFCKIRLCHGGKNKKVNGKIENDSRPRVAAEYFPTKMSKPETYI
ncbi:uncharacterized protein LOC122512704 [Leptopilina heterotoma]|uniref:uncharacterized protein LOC122512704 n=1 Tax=Leptopilina heterotoma TaxID=63436 RepID=UPI001CA9382C|nr:uncharacterized protein LOC122512704 [Leptopilina heterotoma]